MDNGLITAKSIPLEHIRRQEARVGGWQVQLQSTLGHWYDDIDPYNSYASCTCEWCARGNM